MTTTKTYLFTDGSVEPKSGIGMGAYLHVEANMSYEDTLMVPVCLKRFDETSSTKLELQTLLWALKEIDSKGEIVIFTDCQNILSLQGRREKLEKNHYKTKNNQPIKNAKLYQEFYTRLDAIECTFMKIKGHQRQETKSELDKLFARVDKASRKALRKAKLA